MGVFIFFDCCDKNLIVLSRQLLIPLNSSKDDNSFVIIFLFLKFEIFVLFLLPTVKKIVYILLERMLIFPSVLCSPRASPSGYKLHLRKNHAFLSLNIQSDQQETKSRVLPHLLFYRNVRRILIRHFYIIAVHSFCWLPTSQKSIINCLYKLFVIHE
jgi:hypothetical protein